MPRLGRYFLPDQPLNVIRRGSNREPVFFAQDDCPEPKQARKPRR